jgi:hypothetical protein
LEVVKRDKEFPISIPDFSVRFEVKVLNLWGRGKFLDCF